MDKILLDKSQTNGSPSDWEAVVSGVPQGTIMGPIFFLLFVNNVPNTLKCNVMPFADDAKLYSTINKEQDCINLQADLDSLVNWSKDWLINFNKKKCVVLRLKRSIDYIEDHKLLAVTEQADLGIIISNDLKPSKHIAKVASEANGCQPKS